MKRHRAPLLVALLVVDLVCAQVQAGAPSHAPLPILSGAVQDKNFLLLSLIEKSRAVSSVLQSDGELQKLGEERKVALHKAVMTCEADVSCFASALRIGDAEVAQTAAALRRIAGESHALRELALGRLRPSGAYVRYQERTDEELLAAAWLDAAHGINNIIDVYGGAKPARYPEIDSVSFDVKNVAYGRLVHTAAANLDEQAQTLVLFFQPSLRFALYLLQVNRRDEAGRFEPLEKENAAALRHLAAIQWKRFPYSAIVVLGYGPDKPGWSLSPESRLRLEIAVRRYKAGKAPLILVSGGYVHPGQTPYCEAIEMRKALIDDFGVPAESILIDPHARHTTTNLRNAARILYRYRIPFDRRMLITTDSFHSTYVESETFAKRCEQELGYQPVTMIGRVSPFDLAATPRLESLQIDPMDPLDP